MTLDAKIETRIRSLKDGARILRGLKAEVKTRFLRRLADDVDSAFERILAANTEDLSALPPETLSSFRDRLMINETRLRAMTESLRQVAALPDPVGEVVDDRALPNGLRIRRVRAPLGVILMIFESRPNVILEAFSLAFQSGNAIALRGGSDSRKTAAVFYDLIRESLDHEGLTSDLVFGFRDYDRGLIDSLLGRPDLIDIVVPRGGEKLIQHVQKSALMPIIKNDRGLCHAFIHHDADLEMAIRIVVNGKMQRPGVCNSLETILVHEKIAQNFINRLYSETKGRLEWHVDDASFAFLAGKPQVRRASDVDWDTEYLDLILNCRVVSGIDEALAHIETHGSRHSETILTKSETDARRFQSEVDAAAVYWNASTRFTDGFALGLGGELGISTQKLHVRGPVSLRELTTPRWIFDGTGQVRD